MRNAHANIILIRFVLWVRGKVFRSRFPCCEMLYIYCVRRTRDSRGRQSVRNVPQFSFYFYLAVGIDCIFSETLNNRLFSVHPPFCSLYYLFGPVVFARTQIQTFVFKTGWKNCRKYVSFRNNANDWAIFVFFIFRCRFCAENFGLEICEMSWKSLLIKKISTRLLCNYMFFDIK